MTSQTLLNDRRSEFNRFIWDHAADAFQMSFDERRELSETEISALGQIHAAILRPDENEALLFLHRILKEDEDYISLVLQIVGLTRNKIISDMRGSAAAVTQRITVPSSFRGIIKADPWKLAGPFLLKRLRAVLAIVDPRKPTLEQCYQALNQSTWSGYIRQERAKRSGHEAESRLAKLLYSLDLPFVPEGKAENPLCPDTQLDGISFDLVVPNANRPKIVFKATVHTANIGQYGESKDDLEIEQARRWIDTLEEAKRPLLIALIDGVGFRSNRAGLNGVLTKSDEFCQFRTIWKAVVIAGHTLNKRHKILLPREIITQFSDFIRKYKHEEFFVAKEDVSDIVGYIEAGDALVQRNT